MTDKVIGIIGGSGFVGLELVSLLCKSGYKIKIFSRNPLSKHNLSLLGDIGQISIISGNVNNDTEINKFIKGCDIIVNLVAIFFEFGEQNFQNIHIDAPLQIAKLSKKHNVTHLIHISDRWADENSFSKSSKSRGVAEKLVKEAFHNVTIIRLDVLFGKNDGLFFRFSKIIKFLPIIPLPSKSKAIFQPVFVKDVVKAIEKIILNKKFHFNTFELFGPKSYTWKELMLYFSKNIKTKIFLISIPIPLLSIPAFFFGFLPNPLITLDQLRRFKICIMQRTNTMSLQDLDIKPSSLEIEMQKYLKNF